MVWQRRVSCWRRRTAALGTVLSLQALGVCAEEIRLLPSAAGSTLPYLLSADLPAATTASSAVAILFNGGGGYVGLRERGIPQPGANFLVRSRSLFVARGVPVAVIDTPSDVRSMVDGFRRSARHIDDVAAVADDLKKQFPSSRLFLIGTSRGTVSAAYAGAALASRLAGVVLTSSVFNATQGGSGLAGFDFASIKAPLLLVHHADDHCVATPYFVARKLAEHYPLITVHGGKPAQSEACEAFAPHGYFGQEEATVDAMVNWMQGRSYPARIE